MQNSSICKRRDTWIEWKAASFAITFAKATALEEGYGGGGEK